MNWSTSGLIACTIFVSGVAVAQEPVTPEPVPAPQPVAPEPGAQPYEPASYPPAEAYPPAPTYPPPQTTDTGEPEEKKDPSGSGPGGFRLGVDLDYAGGIANRIEGNGAGGALRIGNELDLLVISLTPELMGTYHQFEGPSDPTEFSGQIGFKLSALKIVEPGIFAHAGVGSVDLPVENLTGFALDTGVTLDLTVIPYIELGAHAAYDLVTWEDTLSWYRVGGHLVFAP